MESNTLNILGSNIAIARKKIGFSQIQLAEKLGISQRVLCSYERGSRTMPVIMLPQIAKELNLPVANLLGSKDTLFSLDERTRKAKYLRELEKLETVPAEDRQIVFNLIDSFAGKQATIAK